MSDEEPTPEEQEEAEALARALERGTGSAPSDALESAALLNYARTGGELSDERHVEILADVLRSPKKTKAVKGVRWRWAFAAVSAALGVVLVLSALRDRADSRFASDLPPPPVELLRAQLEVAGGKLPISELSERMDGYRVSVYRTLEAPRHR